MPAPWLVFWVSSVALATLVGEGCPRAAVRGATCTADELEAIAERDGTNVAAEPAGDGEARMEENWLRAGVTSQGRGPATALDLAVGQVQVALTLEGVGDRFHFPDSSVLADPYPILLPSGHTSKGSACREDIAQAARDAFGDATFPLFDAFELHSTQLVLTLQARINVTGATGLLCTFHVPRSCLVGRVAPDVIPPLTLAFPPPSSVVVAQLTGGLAAPVNDAMLADGGVSGGLVLSHGAEWLWDDFELFSSAMQALLVETFGPADAGTRDEVTKGWSARTVNFFLAKRFDAVDITGRSVQRFAGIPRHLIRIPSEAEPAEAPGVVVDAVTEVVHPVVVDDVVAPHGEIVLTFPTGSQTWTGRSFTRHPILEAEVFQKGGFGLDVRLHAGVFFHGDHAAVERAVLRELASAYGPPDAVTPDSVLSITTRKLRVRFGSRLQSDVALQPQSPSWRSPFKSSSGSHKSPASHRTLPLTVPASVLLCPAPNATALCRIPGQQDCQYVAPAADVATYPSMVVKVRPLQYRWAVVGGGPSGINAVGRLADLHPNSLDSILWIDDHGFQVGKLGGYRDVMSQNPCREFQSIVRDIDTYAAFDFGGTSDPLMASRDVSCRFSYVTEPLRQLSQALRSSVTSMRGRVAELHKTPYANVKSTNPSDFTWSLTVGGSDPISVTEGVVLATGAEHRHVPLPVALPEIPFDVAMHAGALQQHLQVEQGRRLASPGKKTVVLVGAGPSSKVALYHLSLVKEVELVLHVVHDLHSPVSRTLVFRPSLTQLNVTRIIARTNTELRARAEDLRKADYVIQCVGFQWPTRVHPQESPKLYSVGVESGNKRLEFIHVLVNRTRLLGKDAANDE